MLLLRHLVSLGDTIRVLFVGNSYSYFNNMPRLVEAIAASRTGPVFETRLVAHGGWTLADHWQDSTTRAAVRERRWNWIVVNEQSTFGDTYRVDGKDRIRSWAGFAASAQQLSREVRAVGARLAI